MMLEIKDLSSWLLSSFEGLEPKHSWGELSFFYNPDRRLEHGTYFLTIKEKDGPHDRASQLDRPGVWRLNFGLPRADFLERFGQLPARPLKGEAIQGPWDFTTLDQLTPHPVYGWMGWVAILNPSVDSFGMLKDSIAAAFRKSCANHRRRR